MHVRNELSGATSVHVEQAGAATVQSGLEVVATVQNEQTGRGGRAARP